MRMRFAFIFLALLCALSACGKGSSEAQKQTVTIDAAFVPENTPASAAAALTEAERLCSEKRFAEARRSLYHAMLVYGSSDALEKAYAFAIEHDPDLTAMPVQMTVGEDLTQLRKLGGGSSLVYKFLKDKETVAAFKPFQKRYQSNYRAEIAAYRLCPVMKCGFDVPVNLPVYFDFDDFSRLYARNSKNPQKEFKEIIPTRRSDGSYIVEGTRKSWIPDFADFPIEFSDIWKPWLNPGVTKEALKAEAVSLLPEFEKRHASGKKLVSKLEPHLKGLNLYALGRQISNLIVFDFLINNWDRFSGSEKLYGVNCQISHGRFMSIDNGASFSPSAKEKPERHLHEISRFSRLTYEAIKRFGEWDMYAYLFPNPSQFERAKFEMFQAQCQKFLEYVESCIARNGEAETFFFE
ncbi:MAG: hypothetical protein IJ165_14535 [Proteobacteria bacterium]|nr:hypothetical protein [Pseudomonadota bacterium]